MRRLFILMFLMLFSLNIQSQEKISIGVFQDPKLALTEDNAGNKPFTLNVIGRIELQGKQFKDYYFFVYPEFEYADLYGGIYKRYSLGIGWSFNKLIDNIEISPNVSYGIIDRFDIAYFNVVTGQADLSYVINDKLKISAVGQYVTRYDLKDKWGTNNYIKFSGYLGLKYNLN